MSTFSISGRMSVKTVKKNFMDAFGGSLRILKDGKLADDGATMASLKAEGCKGGELELKGNTKVAEMKKKVADLYGIDMQVYDANDKKLVDDGLTLASIRVAQTPAPAEKPVEKKEAKEKPLKEPKEKPIKDPKAAASPKAAPAPKPESTPAAQPTVQGFSFYQLMEAALADGAVTSKERAIIIKKAVAQGYDPDEVEMMIDGRIAKMRRKQQQQAQAQQQPKPQPQPKQEPQKTPSAPETRESLMNKAKKLQEIGDTKEAIKIYKKVIMDYGAGTEGDCYGALFEIYKKDGNYKEALKFGAMYADLNLGKSYRWRRELWDIVETEFNGMLRSNRKKDAARLLDTYVKYFRYDSFYFSDINRLQGKIK